MGALTSSGTQRPAILAPPFGTTLGQAPWCGRVKPQLLRHHRIQQLQLLQIHSDHQIPVDCELFASARRQVVCSSNDGGLTWPLTW
jgi:hypothetical protein